MNRLTVLIDMRASSLLVKQRMKFVDQQLRSGSRAFGSNLERGLHCRNVLKDQREKDEIKMPKMIGQRVCDPSLKKKGVSPIFRSLSRDVQHGS